MGNDKVLRGTFHDGNLHWPCEGNVLFDGRTGLRVGAVVKGKAVLDEPKVVDQAGMSCNICSAQRATKEEMVAHLQEEHPAEVAEAQAPAVEEPKKPKAPKK